MTKLSFERRQELLTLVDGVAVVVGPTGHMIPSLTRNTYSQAHDDMNRFYGTYSAFDNSDHKITSGLLIKTGNLSKEEILQVVKDRLGL